MPASELRDLLEFYAIAQELAAPIINEKWIKKQERLREREILEPRDDHATVRVGSPHPDLFD